MAKRKSAAKAPVTTAASSDYLSLPQTIAWWSLLALVFTVPIAMSNISFLSPAALPLSYDQFDIIKVFLQRVLTCVALAAWAWHMLVKGGRIRHTPVDWAILAFLAWVTVSTIFSIHPPTAFFGKYRRFEGLLSFLNYAALYFLVLQFADRPSRVRRLAQFYFAAGIIVAGYGVLQFLGADPVQWGSLPFEARRAFSTYGNPDLLGGFLMFGVFVSAGLALAEEKLVVRGIYWAGFLLNVMCTIVAFTRSAWVGSVVGVTVFLIIAIRQRAPWKTEDWVFAGATSLVSLSIILQSLSNPNSVMNFGQRVASIFQFNSGSAKTRFEIWQSAIDATKERPIFGFGPDTFRLVFPKYKPVEYVADAGYLSVADNVHNYPLQLAAGIGIPGVMLFYGIAIWAAIRTAPLVLMPASTGKANRLILGGFYAACAAYLTHLFFGLSVTGTSVLYWIALGAVLAPTAKSTEIKPVPGGIGIAAVLVVLAAFGIYYQVVLMQADKAYLMARVASQGADRTSWTKRAVELNPYNDMYRAEVGLALTDEAVSLLTGGGADPNLARAKFTEAEQSLLDTIRFVPSEYDNYVFLANLYNLGGSYLDPAYFEQAVAIADKGIKVEPFGPAIRFQRARALQELRRTDEAIEELRYCVEMDPRYTDAVLFLSQLLEQSGRPAEALSLLESTEATDPGKPGVMENITRLRTTTATSPTTTP